MTYAVWITILHMFNNAQNVDTASISIVLQYFLSYFSTFSHMAVKCTLITMAKVMHSRDVPL